MFRRATRGVQAAHARELTAKHGALPGLTDPSAAASRLREEDDPAGKKNKGAKQEAAERSRRRKWIGTKEEAPAFLTDNPYLLYGFRLGYSMWDAGVSVFENNHNEIGNVWTHLLGAAYMVYLAYDASVMFIPDHARPWDRSALVLYCLAAALCMTFSTVFHLFGCVGHDTYNKLCQRDYCGINILIYASDMIGAYYGWYCYPDWQQLYMTVLTVLGGFCILGPLMPFYYDHAFRFVRVGIFVSFGMAGGVSLFHASYVLGLDLVGYILFGYLMMGAFYLTGVGIYVSNVPERWFPGTFDNWGNSHNMYVWIN